MNTQDSYIVRAFDEDDISVESPAKTDAKPETDPGYAFEGCTIEVNTKVALMPATA